MKTARARKNLNNKVEIHKEDIDVPFSQKRAGVYVKKVLSELDKENWDLSVLFCSNKFIKTLNKKYRNINEATDVLSFSMGETSKDGRFLAGDVIISIEALEENEKAFSVDMEEELSRLLIHGILHLSGEDHKTNGKNEPMLKKQEEILLKINYSIFGPRLGEI